MDVVDEVPYVREALALALPRTSPAFEVRVSVSTWMDYSASLAALSNVTVFRAELNDHVPAALKTRALVELDVAPVIMMSTPSPAHEARLRRAGAAAVVHSADSLAVLVDRIVHRTDTTSRPDAPSGIELTDREMQVACLYCGRTAPSAAQLGAYLRLQEQTVRRHLSRTRELFRAGGVDVSTRMKLRTALIDDGWLFPTL